MFATTGQAAPGARSGGIPRHSASAGGGFGGIPGYPPPGAGSAHGVHASYSVPVGMDGRQNPEEALVARTEIPEILLSLASPALLRRLKRQCAASECGVTTCSV